MKKGDRFLILAVLLAAAAAFGWMKWHETAGASVIVQVNGETVQTLSLSVDQTVEITGYQGGSNLLVISGGQAWIREASCPDLICVHQGRISMTGQTIICLPNRVVVSISGGKEGPDDVAR